MTAGPGYQHAATVLAVMPGPADGGGDAAFLGQFFASGRAVAPLCNPYGLQNQDWHGRLVLWTGPHDLWGPRVAAAPTPVQLTRKARQRFGSRRNPGTGERCPTAVMDIRAAHNSGRSHCGCRDAGL